MPLTTVNVSKKQKIVLALFWQIPFHHFLPIGVTEVIEIIKVTAHKHELFMQRDLIFYKNKQLLEIFGKCNALDCISICLIRHPQI